MRIKHYIKNASILTLGQIATYSCSFLRNLALARMLTKEDYSLSAIFATAISLFEFATRLSFGTQIVQSRIGNNADFKNTYHSIQIVAGILGATLLYATSQLIADAFDVPDKAWAFKVISLIPLFKGFENLDHFRQRRESKFAPGVYIETYPQLIITLLTIPLLLLLEDYRAILLLLLTKSIFTLSISHWVSLQPYGLAWNKSYLPGIFKFTWPLLLNGFILLAYQQADQVLVGTQISLEKLADYSIATSITILPYFVFAQIFGTLFTPKLSQLKSDKTQFNAFYSKTLNATAVSISTLTIPFSVASATVISIIYGEQYSNLGNIPFILGIAFSIRLYRSSHDTCNISKGTNTNQIYASLTRTISIPLAIICINLDYGPEAIAICSMAGEILALTTSSFTQKRVLSIPFSINLKPLTIITLSALICITLQINVIQSSPVKILTFTLIATTLCTILCGILFNNSTTTILKSLRGNIQLNK